MNLPAITWQHVATLFLVMAFSGFVLYNTASNPDWSEVKTWLGLFAVSAARELGPIVKKWWDSTNKTLNEGQVE